MNPDYPLEPKHHCGSGALAAICGRIRAGGGAPTCHEHSNGQSGMKTHKRWGAALLVAVLAVPGCATAPGKDGKTSFSSPESCIAAYTVGGAALGGVFGHLLGGDSTSAATGAVAGGVAAFAYAWGSCFKQFSTAQSQQVKDYKETSQQIRYSPRQGTVVKINDYALDPVVAAPGDTVKFKAKYTVMTPTAKDIPVTETRILKFYDKSQNKYVQYAVPENTVIAPGSRSADGSVAIPGNAEPGQFKLAFKVDAGGKSDVREIPFTINSAKHALARPPVVIARAGH